MGERLSQVRDKGVCGWRRLYMGEPGLRAKKGWYGGEDVPGREARGDKQVRGYIYGWARGDWHEEWAETFVLMVGPGARVERGGEPGAIMNGRKRYDKELHCCERWSRNPPTSHCPPHRPSAGPPAAASRRRPLPWPRSRLPPRCGGGCPCGWTEPAGSAGPRGWPAYVGGGLVSLQVRALGVAPVPQPVGDEVVE